MLTLPCTFASRSKLTCGSFLLLPLLIVLHLATYATKEFIYLLLNYHIPDISNRYATHLLLAERAHFSEFHYLVVKYGLGQSFIILVPFAVIACKSDLRAGMVTTFSSAVLCPVQKQR